MLLLWAPSTVTVWLLGAFGPDVDVVTVRLPVSAVQVMVKGADTAPPAVTVTVRDGPFVTVQFDATSPSCTVWLPAGRVSAMVWLSAIDCGVPLSTVQV